MSVELKLSDATDAHVIQNLWPLYQHDVSEFASSIPNRHGLFGVDDSVTTLAAHAARQARWWTEPGALFPYLILADGRPAGFNLIAARACLADAIDADFVVHEFFVLHAYRGRGVAEEAAVRGFGMHEGTWEIVTYPTHARAIAFWRRVVRGYTSAYSEEERDHPWGRRVCFGFDNASRPSEAGPQETVRPAPETAADTVRGRRCCDTGGGRA
ncbi:MAG: hypothetical protein KDA22_05580 [Phycisphaerales bacterium]|nr:hypothetical protein [Phycisphaerales bacterium]